MGIYLPNMEMPRKGQMLVIFPDGTSYVCFNGMRERLTQTTVVPVPPHGRLGDLDKLENGLRHMAKYQFGERQQGILGCCETIRLAPTIIPAEEGET